MTRRSRRGRGTVFYDAARGCYVGQLSLGRDPQTGRRKRSPKVYAATEDECWALLDAMREELRKTGTVAPRDVTVDMVLRDLLASPPAEWASPLTLRGNADRIARVTAAVGKAKLQRLTVGQVERMLRDYGDSGLVFASESGGPRWPQDVRRQFARVCQRAGLGAEWHPHETRHTWVSVLSDAGVDIEDIADAAGHVTSSVTRNVYRHQLADKLTKAPAAMDRILGTGEVNGS